VAHMTMMRRRWAVFRQSDTGHPTLVDTFRRRRQAERERDRLQGATPESPWRNYTYAVVRRSGA